MFPERGLGPGAAVRLEQHVEGPVELVLGLLEVADGEFLLPLVKCGVGLGDELDDGIVETGAGAGRDSGAWTAAGGVT